jgi:membrane protein implicated in regulation of membrane protease activity
MFLAAAVLAGYTFAVGIATVIIAIAVALPAWLASLIVFGAMLLVTLLLVLVGRAQVKQTGSPKPERAIENLREDVAAVKGGLHS